MVKTLFFALFILVGCSSGGKEERDKIRALFQKRNFVEIEKILQESKEYKKEENKLLTLYERASLNWLKNDCDNALKSLSEAKDLSKKLYTKSVVKKGKTYILNDNYDQYYGEKYEQSMAHLYSVLCQIKSPNKKSLFNSRAEVLSWNTNLSSFKNVTLGKPVFKDDLMAKILGAYVHERIGTRDEQQIALQLYKDAQKILFKNYNNYKTFNAKNESFRSKFSDLHKVKKSEVEKNYVSKTDHTKTLEKFLDDKILELSYIVRRRDFNRKIKGKKRKELVKKLKAEREMPRVAVLVEKGLISPKIPKDEYFGLEAGMRSKDPAIKIVSAIGASVLTLFAVNELGLLTPPGHWRPSGYYIGEDTIRFMSKATSVKFELPGVAKKPSPSLANLIVKDLDGKEVMKRDISLVNSLNDISAQEVEEKSASVFWKTGMRVAVKHIVAIIAAHKTYKSLKKKESGGSFFAKTAAVIQYAASVKAIQESEKADTRHWTTIPEALYFDQFKIPEGQYKLSLELDSGSKQYDLGALELSEGRKNLLITHKILN